MTSLDFVSAERVAQAAFFAETLAPELIMPGTPYRLEAGRRGDNLAPSIRAPIADYFAANKIQWHTHANHGLSSQTCCLNFLAPLARHPLLLARVVERALGLANLEMLPVEEGSDGEPLYLGFEWTGRADYLSEWPVGGTATRGANATSADAVVRFRSGGSVTTALIEWKYTESYGAPIDPMGNPTRLKRYSDKVFAPVGPIQDNLGLKVEDFFWEPFYQLLRQQMLAWRMKEAREDRADRVVVLHISPWQNVRLHKVTAPALQRFGADAFGVFRATLVRPEDFVSVSTEDLFGPLLADDTTDPDHRAWADYLQRRYTFLTRV